VPRSLHEIYRLLRSRYGHAGWWPGQSALEICLGAILTQNTAWPNAARALEALRARKLLSWHALSGMPPARLAPILRSSGTFRVKARRVAAFVAFLGREYGGSVAAMRREQPGMLRTKLLSVEGIGPETADAIALYALGMPHFVVDAYTRRVFGRLGLLEGSERYDEVQRLLTTALPKDAELYADYHAQIVRLAKEACRARPRCERCPLEPICPRRGVKELCQ
jgi:endonuclease-3 related protein